MITNIRTSVPSTEANVIWRVCSGAGATDGAGAQRSRSPVRASYR
jgi:hypothetical protein